MLKYCALLMLAICAPAQAAVITAKAGEACALIETGAAECQWVDDANNVVGAAIVSLGLNPQPTQWLFFSINIAPIAGESGLPTKGLVTFSGLPYQLLPYGAEGVFAGLKGRATVRNAADGFPVPPRERSTGVMTNAIHFSSTPITSMQWRFVTIPYDSRKTVTGPTLRSKNGFSGEGFISGQIGWSVTSGPPIRGAKMYLSSYVPEPSVWMTLILGFGVIGAGMRRVQQGALRPRAIRISSGV